MTQGFCLCHWKDSEIDWVESEQVVYHSQKRKPDSLLKFSGTRLFHYADSFPVGLPPCLECCVPTEKFKLLWLAPKAFYLPVLPSTPPHSYLTQAHLPWFSTPFGKLLNVYALHRVYLEWRPLAPACLKDPMVLVSICSGDVTLSPYVIPSCCPSLSCPAFSEAVDTTFLLFLFYFSR